jgi:hypothetical protein
MRFDADEMSRLYHDYRGVRYEELRASFEPGYADRNQGLLAGDLHIPAVEAFLRPWAPAHPAILDWGGDTGLNTPLRSIARQHDVLEISGKSPVQGAVSVSEEGLGEAPYDLIVLSNVLEHIPEPAELLQRIAAVMIRSKSQVRLYLEVPFEPLMREAETNPQAWRNKRHWHEHINFFSPASMLRLLDSNGLRALNSAQIQIPGERDAVAFAIVCELSDTA